MNIPLILLQNTVAETGYTPFFPFLIFPVLIIAFAGHRIRRRKRLAMIKADYENLLNQLRSDPTNSDLKRKTFELGTRYAALSDTMFGKDNFDESNLKSDIDSASK